MDAGAGRKLMDDLAARRRQAMTEVEAAKRVRRDDLRGEALTRAKLAHLDAALKIDPLCEEAAYRRVSLLWELYGRNGFVKYSGTKAVHELMFAAARYNDLFPQNPDRISDVQDRAWVVVRMTPLINMYKGRPVPIDRDLRRLLGAMSRMIEISTNGDPRHLSAGCPRFFITVCRGMRVCKVPLEQREAWIDGILAGVRKQMTQIKKLRPLSRENFVFHHHWLHVIAAIMSAEDGRIERTKKLVQEIQRILDAVDKPPLESSQHEQLVKLLRTVIIKIDNPQALARFDQWVLAKQTPIRPIWFGNLPKSHYSVYPLAKPLGETTKIVYAPNRRILGLPMAPLCEGDGYMYIVARDNPNGISWSDMRGGSGGSAGAIILRIPLDGTGRPKGKNVPSQRRYGPIPVWDSIEMLPQPKVRKYLHVLSTLFIDGKLYLGTMYSGLLVFDAKDKAWTVVDPAAGLPCWGIYWLHDRGDGTLLCIGRDIVNGGSESFCFSYSRKDGQIRVLRKTDLKRHVYVNYNILGLWENAGRVMTIVMDGLMEDILGDKPKLRRLGRVRTPGWKRDSNSYIGHFARVGERLFVKVRCGLLELDTSGAVKERIFTGGWGVLPGTSGRWLLTSVDVPNPTPGTGTFVSDGRYLWFTGSRVLYDPTQRLWYGPLTKPRFDFRGYSIATPAGLWLADSHSATFIDRDKFMAAARATDRVTTTKEYVKRRNRAIAEQTAPVPHARILLALRQFKQARDVLEAHLRDHADDPHAVLLMGMVCDAWGLKDLRRAEDCYRKLEQWGDPKVRFTGMYMRLHLLVRQRRWADAAGLLNTCRKSFCRVHEKYERDLAGLEKQIGKHAPRPAASPANVLKESHP